VSKIGSICFRGFCILELFSRKESVIETILIDYFVFSAIFVTFVLRVLKSVRSVWSVVGPSLSCLSCWGFYDLCDLCDLWWINPFRAFRIKVFIIRAICVICGGSISPDLLKLVPQFRLFEIKTAKF